MRQMASEQRQASRKEVLAPAVIHMEIMGKMYRSQAIVRNISTAGMLMALYDFDEELKQMDLVNMTANIRFRCSDSNIEHTVTCLTIRAENLTYSIQIGAVFTEMTHEGLQSMRNYCL